MSIVSKLLKAGLAKKVMAEAQKPQNQAKAKQLFKQLSTKYKAQKAGRH